MNDWILVFSALGGLAGLGAFVTAISTARQSAKKSELEALRFTIDELQEENHRLRNRITELERENELLRKALGLPAFQDKQVRMAKGLARDNS